jgi:hypothetical protein
LLIHPEVPGLSADFTPERHFLPYRYGDYIALRRQIDRALDMTAAERARIITEGMDWARAHHTYRHRAEAMLAVVLGD